MILLGYWAAFALYPLPGPTFDFASGGRARPSWPHHPTGFAAHWDKNSNLAWAFDTWFLNLFPASRAVHVQRRRLRDAELHPHAGDDDPGPAGRRRARADRGRAGPRLLWLVVAGGICTGRPAGDLGELGVCPVVKRIWTPSWVLFSGGWCFLFLAGFYAILDVTGRPVLGVPAPGHRHELDRRLLHGRPVRGASSRKSLTIHLGKDVVQRSSARPTSPCSTARPCFLVLWLILFWMYRRKLFLRI